MRYQKERTKAAATLLLCYNAGGCGQLTLHECDIESIYWLKTNLSFVVGLKSKLSPTMPSKQKGLHLEEPMHSTLHLMGKALTLLP